MTTQAKQEPMSTRDYLNQLNLNQLRFARDTAAELIAQKEAAPRVLLWQVCDENSVLEHFPKEDYLKAAEFLLERAKKNALNHELKAYRKKLELTFITVPESEVQDYLATP